MASSPALEKFLQSPGDPVVGVHMSPPRAFGPPNPTRPEDAFLILETATAGVHHVIVTKSAGLFVPIPPDLVSDEVPSSVSFDAKWAFLNEAADAVNTVLSELALSGQVSSPASPVLMSSGVRVENRARATSAGGGREVYLDRTLYVLLDILSDRWLSWPVTDPAILTQDVALRRATALQAISGALPELVVGAYANLSRHHLAEAIVDGWVVVEQLLDALWRDHIAGATEPGRREALRDTRNYTAAVRTEVLLTSGRLSSDLYASLNRARKDRNDLAHGANASLDAAERVASAMHQFLQERLATTAAPPIAARFVTW